MFWLDDLHNGGPATFEGFIRIHQEESDVKFVMVATARHDDVALLTLALRTGLRLRELRGLCVRAAVVLDRRRPCPHP